MKRVLDRLEYGLDDAVYRLRTYQATLKLEGHTSERLLASAILVSAEGIVGALLTINDTLRDSVKEKTLVNSLLCIEEDLEAISETLEKLVKEKT